MILLAVASGLTFGCGESEPPYQFTGVSNYFRLDDKLSEPFGIAVRDGRVYYSDGHTGEIIVFQPGDGVTDRIKGFDTPSGIVVDKDGDIFVADTGSNTIRSIGPKRDIDVEAGVPGQRGFADGDARSALFNGPTGLAIDDDGRLFVADTYNDRIRVVEKGTVRTLAGGTKGFADGSGSDAMFDTPLGIAVWQGDKLLVADSGNRRIRVVEADGTVWTLAGNGGGELRDGFPGNASLASPTAVMADERGVIFIADGNAIRAIGLRTIPFLETIAGGRRGSADGTPHLARFNRPSGLAFLETTLLIADSDNGELRSLHGVKSGTETSRIIKPEIEPMTAEEFRNQAEGRWPYDPPDKVREIAGTLGEIRGEIKDQDSQAWFHNGLDIPGAFGETATFIRDEKVLDPNAVSNFGTLRELLRMPTIGYVHINLGRDIANVTYQDPRFQFFTNSEGKLAGVRVARGERFKAGEKVGTLNAMNHVHLIAGRPGAELNALDALILPGVSDSIAPVIEDIALYDRNWTPLETKSAAGRIILTDRSRIIVRAYDRKDGNAERRRLAPYKIGYAFGREGEIPDKPETWSISFEKMPPHDAVDYTYGVGSHSGATGVTVFNFIASNEVDGEQVSERFLDVSGFDSGSYILRAFAADRFGNITFKDIHIEVIK